MEVKKKPELDRVAAAQEAVKQHQAQAPGGYESPFRTDLDATFDAIKNRPAFQFDLNGDAMVSAMRDNAAAAGKKAMMDTMGRAATLTGGYGNSYAQMAGQQAYQGELQKGNQMIPEYYRLAMQRYGMEGQQLNDRLGMLMQQENQAYGRHQDALARYDRETARLQGILDNERRFQYGKDRDALADRQRAEEMAYRKDRDSIADQNRADEMAYRKEQDAKDEAYRQQQADRQAEMDRIAREQWERQFAENNRRWQESQKPKGSSGGYSGSDSSDSSGSSSRDSGSSSGSQKGNSVKPDTKPMTPQQWNDYKRTGGGGSAVQNYSSYAAYRAAFDRYLKETGGKLREN